MDSGLRSKAENSTFTFTPGTDFENLLSRAQFNPVSSRTAQAATLKAEKTGATTVDLEAAKGKTNDGATSSTEEGTTTEPGA